MTIPVSVLGFEISNDMYASVAAAIRRAKCTVKQTAEKQQRLARQCLVEVIRHRVAAGARAT